MLETRRKEIKQKQEELLVELIQIEKEIGEEVRCKEIDDKISEVRSFFKSAIRDLTLRFEFKGYELNAYHLNLKEGEEPGFDRQPDYDSFAFVNMENMSAIDVIKNIVESLAIRLRVRQQALNTLKTKYEITNESINKEI